MPAHPALFLSRTLFQRYGSFKIDYAIAADFEFVARIFAHPTFRYAYLPEVLVKMRTGGTSTKGWRSTLVLNREVMRACRENGIRTNYLKILSKYPAKALEFLVPGALAALVAVLEAHDVVLAEVAARLHLDELERQLARVLQPVLRPDRDVRRFVLRQEELVLAARDPRRAGDHDPVLGAVVVHLQRKRRARLDHDALHLETLAGVDAVVAAPGAVHVAVRDVLGARLAP